MSLMEKKQSLSRKLKCGIFACLTVAMGLTCFAANAFTATVSGESADTQKTSTDGNPPQSIYKVGGSVQGPKLISSVDPEYPSEVRKGKNKVEGICLLSLVVDEKGKPRQVHVKRSLGAAFDNKALEAVKKWRFAPATLKGQPVPVALDVEITFKLY